jgi:hypothetical protein
VFATTQNQLAKTGGRHARQFAISGLTICLILIGASKAVAADDKVAVVEKDRTYDVRATFTVARSIPVVTAVLTDYVRIPHYMPEVRTSQLLERQDDRAVATRAATRKSRIA